jgi:hypothetical protein
MKKIVLENIKSLVPFMSDSWAAARCEAAAFCLEHNTHKAGISMNSHVPGNPTYLLYWSLIIDKKIKNTFNDTQVATEEGAEGMAALFVNELTPYQIIRRSAKTTGIDYYLGYKSDSKLIYQDSARLEVSGLLSGSDSEFKRRVKVKKEQTLASQGSGLPAYVAVTDFGKPRIAFEQV